MAAAENVVHSSPWAIQTNCLRDAEASARRLLRQQPLNASALAVLARAHFERGDAEEAVRLLQQAVYSEPHYYPAYDCLVRVFRHSRRAADCLNAYDEWARRLCDSKRDNAWSDAAWIEIGESAISDYIAKYYAARASEYDNTCAYMDPARASALGSLKEKYQAALKDRDVLEIACGTGYWTAVIAPVARSVLATDRNVEVLSLVKQRLANVSNIRFQAADAYALDCVAGRFNAAFSHFWWSHIPREMLRSFLATLHSKLDKGARVIFSDNLPYLHPAPRRLDAAGNLYEERVLRNAERYEVIKNFPVEDEIRSALAGMADEVLYTADVDHGIWTVMYTVNQ